MERRGEFDRVVIVGTSCSGKSTLARELSRRLGTPHVELDELFWGPNWTARSAEDFLASVDRTTAEPMWIVDGNYSATRGLVLQRATSVIWLNYPLSTLMRRAVNRTFRRLVTRERIFNGNREPLLGFLHLHWIPWWVLQSYRRLRREYATLFASPEFAHLRVLEIGSARELETFLSEQGDANGAR
jgi:adenylate kinase family enzyme